MIPLLLFFALAAAPPAYPNPSLLIEPAELAKNAADFRILDVRGRNLFDMGHVPGAVWVDVAAWSKAFTEKPDAIAWANYFFQAAIDPTGPIVVYDNDVRDAARIWWILKYWGCENVRLLNGGWAGWLADGGRVSTDPPQIKPRPMTLRPQPGRLATKDQLLDAIKNRPPQIVDARSDGEFCGTANTAKRNGAIPGAVHIEWIETLDPKTKRFKSPAELQALLNERHIDVDKPAVTYCQSGGRAAVLAFTLELMGGKQVGNYYKSWAEWGNHSDTPIVKPATK